MSALFSCVRPTYQVVRPLQDDELNINPLDILLVDKNRATLKFNNYVLQNAGHKVTIANDGEEALRIIQQKWIDDQSIFQVIMFDLHIPCDDAMYYTNIIKRELEGNLESNGIVMPSQFVVGMTKHTKYINEQDYDKLLLKPFSLEQFNTMIRRSKHMIHYITRFQKGFK